jgi:hypothetical protein
VSPSAGDLWFDTSTGASYIYYGSAWVELGGGTMSPYQATSTTRPSSPWTGQHVYETDTSLEYVYGGSSWQQVSGGTAVGNSGLVFVKSQTIGSAVASVTVTDAFSATYDNYKIVVNTTGSAAASTCVQLGSSVTGYYGFLIYGTSTGAGTVLSATRNNTAKQFWLGGGAGGGNPHVANFELMNPFATTFTKFSNGTYATTDDYGTMQGEHKVSASYTSFIISPDTGTLTGGTITVYGYRKA